MKLCQRISGQSKVFGVLCQKPNKGIIRTVCLTQTQYHRKAVNSNFQWNKMRICGLFYFQRRRIFREFTKLHNKKMEH